MPSSKFKDPRIRVYVWRVLLTPAIQPASGSTQAYVISTARARAHHATPFQNSSFLVFGLGQECQKSLSVARSSSAKNTSACCHASHLVDESVRSFLNATAPAARIPFPPQTPPTTLVICLELVHDGCCMCRLYFGGFSWGLGCLSTKWHDLGHLVLRSIGT